MTEKPFKPFGDQIHLNGKYWCRTAGKHSAEIIATALNELIEENERLKEEIKSLTDNLEEDYIIFKRDKNPPNPKFCSECWNYETEYEEVIAFGDYETLTKISCSKGHSIFDDNDAMDCPDYDPKD